MPIVACLVLTMGLIASVSPALAADPTTPGTVFRDCDICPEMVVVPAGSFLMGRNPAFEDGGDDELPQHRVTIGRPFAIGKYEVTQTEWVSIMGSNPSEFKGRTNPVEQVSWNDIRPFLQRLSHRAGKTYRLPSEAEWEYAARAGSDTKYFFGDEEGALGQHAWFSGNSGNRTHPVGQLRPNRFGLFDVHGNVWEWVEDCWNSSYNGAPSDGSAWTQGNCSRRVLRGGSWDDDPWVVRSANRIRYTADGRSGSIGFRLARTLNP